MRENVVLTLTGPSCSGKSTMEKMLNKMGFVSMISTTTRPPRAGEVDGEQYHFVTKSEFKRLDIQGRFIERVEFNGNLYGVGKADCERAFAEGRPAVVVVEPEGLNQIVAFCKKMGWSHTGVFVDVDPRVQFNRFIGRTMADFPEGRDGEMVSSKVVRSLLSRLSVMNNAESDWKKQTESLVHYTVAHFNEANEQRVLKTVAYLATGNVAFIGVERV